MFRNSSIYTTLLLIQLTISRTFAAATSTQDNFSASSTTRFIVCAKQGSFFHLKTFLWQLFITATRIWWNTPFLDYIKKCFRISNVLPLIHELSDKPYTSHYFRQNVLLHLFLISFILSANMFSVRQKLFILVILKLQLAIKSFVFFRSYFCIGTVKVGSGSFIKRKNLLLLLR